MNRGETEGPGEERRAHEGSDHGRRWVLGARMMEERGSRHTKTMKMKMKKRTKKEKERSSKRKKRKNGARIRWRRGG